MVFEQLNKRRTSAPCDKEGMGVNLIGPIEFINGLGTSTRGYHESILKAGIPCNVVPWRIGFEHLSRLVIPISQTGPYKVNLVHLNFDLLSQGILRSPQLSKLVNPNNYNICIPYWELSSILPEWHAIIHHFDEIWCASSFVSRAFDAVSTIPVNVIRPSLTFSGKASDRGREGFGLPGHAFVFLYAIDAGGIWGRKNPEAFVNAYVHEFSEEEGALCVVKIGNAELVRSQMSDLIESVAGRKDIIFMCELLNEGDMSALFSLIDCYVSPHRSEGLGLTILEAMAAHKPVIATPYGGVADFITESTAYPIDYRLVEVGPDNPPYPPGYIWAEPEITSIRRQMRHVFSNQSEARTKGNDASQSVRRLFSVETTATAMHARLNQIWESQR